MQEEMVASKRSVMVFKAFKYRLYPSKAQQRLLEQTLETCRRWYNACLEERKLAWESEQKNVGKFEQLAKVRDYRRENLFAAQLHSHILQVVVQDLDKAFQAFFRRVKKGETPGYPRFKGRERFDSFGLKEYGNGFKLDGRRLRLTGIGRVRVRWHRPLKAGSKPFVFVDRPGNGTPMDDKFGTGWVMDETSLAVRVPNQMMALTAHPQPIQTPSSKYR